MARIETAFFDIGTLDTLAYRDSAIHRLDPRAKVITTLAFTLAVVSFGKYEVSALIPFILFPVVMMTTADLPCGYLGKKLLLAAPFALLVGIFNPLLDRSIQLELGSLALSGGWISFASIMLRFSLTVTAALILIATTSFTGVCLALERLGAPRPFVLQLLFLHRYIFVLIEESFRLVRARELRSFHGRGHGMKIFGHLIGQLLLRTLDRAQRIHMAMLCRGFKGEIHMTRQLAIGRNELLFIGGWCSLFLALRLVNLPQILGSLAERLLS